ncbi:MAG TPA: radical SAM protein [Burkholderiaceae bacterium]
MKPYEEGRSGPQQERFLLPMMFQALVVESTTRCNAKCGMCYQGAGPKGSDYLGDAALSVDDIKQVLRSGLSIPSLTRRFHMAGGEAFIKVDECVEIFSYASALGWREVSCTTNAYWAADIAKAHGLARRLRDAGLQRAEISWDHWHGPHIPAHAINNCLHAMEANDIQTNLRLLTSRSHSAEEALAALSPAALAKASVITSAPVFQVGRAMELPAEDIYASDQNATCHSALNLTVNARGFVYPCCAGFDQTNSELFGSIRERDIADIAADINRSLLVRLVVFEGINSLRPILQLLGEELKDQYSSICGMCFEVFSNPERVRKLTDFFQQIEAEALREALQKRKSDSSDADELEVAQ